MFGTNMGPDLNSLDRFERMEAALLTAADVFATYAAHHRAKGPEHAEKAEKNAALSKMIMGVLAQGPTETPPTPQPESHKP